jgi:hypothetical protein
MTHEQYAEMPGVSWSSLKDLAVSPFRFWARNVDPNRPPSRTSPEMTFGSALHCAVLEPEQFRKCRGFAQRWGFKRMVVTNLFTFRANRRVLQLGAIQ